MCSYSQKSLYSIQWRTECSKKEISIKPPRKKVKKSIYSMFQKQTVSGKQSNNIVLSNPKQSSSSSVSASIPKTTPVTVKKWKLELQSWPKYMRQS